MRRKDSRSVCRRRKYTLNGRAIEIASASGRDNIVGVKVQAASRPPYDHPMALKPHGQQPTVADLLCCKWGTWWRHSGGKALDQPTMSMDTSAHLFTEEAPFSRHQGPEKLYLLRKYTLNGRATEAATASGPDTKVGVKVQEASRPPYDHPTALKPHVQQPTVEDLLGSKLGA